MPARFAIGERVLVLDSEMKGHSRTPAYIMGKTGTIVDLLGAFRNPEQLAYGGDGRPEMLLYRVGFRQTDVWPNYSGARTDSIVIEIYEHWLQPALDEP